MKRSARLEYVFSTITSDLLCSNFKIFFQIIFTAFCFYDNGSLFAQPIQLPAFSVETGIIPPKGFYFMTVLPANSRNVKNYTAHNLIMDENGNVAFLKSIALKPKDFACDFKLHANGIMSFFYRDKFFLIDSSFTIVDSVFILNGLIKDNHEFQILSNGNYLLLGTEEIQMDLSEFQMFKGNHSPGSKSATVVCGVLQEQDKLRNVVFEWHSKDYFHFNDVDSFYVFNPEKVNWTHINAVEQDIDGHFLVSIRNFNEITKVNRIDSSIIWRLGGNRNQFKFINDSGKFIAQHDIRRTTKGTLTLFDNGRDGRIFHAACAKEYRLDENKKTATLIWNHQASSTSCSAEGLGNVQRTVDGNTLINYGIDKKSNTLFNVILPNGEKIFQISFVDTLRSYRVFHYPELPFKIKRPVISTSYVNNTLWLEASGCRECVWSTGERSKRIEIKQKGKYLVYSEIGNNGYSISLPFIVGQKTLDKKQK